MTHDDARQIRRNSSPRGASAAETPSARPARRRKTAGSGRSGNGASRWRPHKPGGDAAACRGQDWLPRLVSQNGCGGAARSTGPGGDDAAAATGSTAVANGRGSATGDGRGLAGSACIGAAETGSTAAGASGASDDASLTSAASATAAPRSGNSAAAESAGGSADAEAAASGSADRLGAVKSRYGIGGTPKAASALAMSSLIAADLAA
ncbi:MAG TPA: hypothetical protein VME92_09550 [Acetobacteraceae bacterium]|nr:hypothetical protein [Acetobacteraceae bacterium]